MNDSGSSNIWLFLELLARKRNFIVAVVLIATLVAVATVFLLPQWYQATVLLLPPKDTAVSIPGMQDLSQVVSVTGGLDLPSKVTSSDVYARMLKSRTITDTIINRFGLMDHYETGLRFYAREALLGHADFRVTDEGLLQVSFEDRDPQLAADIANAFVSELERLNQEIASHRARLNREFIEGRLVKIEEELRLARDELEQFQLEHKTIDFNQQTRLAIDQAVSLKIGLAKTELELSLKEQKLGKDHAELAELRQRRRIQKEQIERLEKTNVDSSFFSLPVSAIPSLKGLFEVLYSRVQVNESLYAMLLKQLEQAKIQENNQLTAISVLDRASPPEMKHRPRRGLIVASTFGLSLLAAIFLAMLIDYLDKMREKHPHDHQRVLMFIHAFLGWFPGIKKK